MTKQAEQSRNGASAQQGNFSPEVVAWMGRRSEQFHRATHGKGKPMTYGTMGGRKEKEK